MKSEFLCAYCDTSLSWIDWSAIVDFLYEMLSLSLVNKGTFIVFYCIFGVSVINGGYKVCKPK